MAFVIGSIVIIWHIIGMVVLACAIESSHGPLNNVVGAEFVNPCWVYKNYRVNLLGALLLSLIYNLLCPLVSVCYWIYKICTIGRKV